MVISFASVSHVALIVQASRPGVLCNIIFDIIYQFDVIVYIVTYTGNVLYPLWLTLDWSATYTGNVLYPLWLTLDWSVHLGPMQIILNFPYFILNSFSIDRAFSVF